MLSSGKPRVDKRLIEKDFAIRSADILLNLLIWQNPISSKSNFKLSISERIPWRFLGFSLALISLIRFNESDKARIFQIPSFFASCNPSNIAIASAIRVRCSRFQAASVNKQKVPFAIVTALRMQSYAELLFCWKMRSFLVIHKLQLIHGKRGLATSPVGDLLQWGAPDALLSRGRFLVLERKTSYHQHIIGD